MSDLERLLPNELLDDLPDPSKLKAVVRQRVQEAYMSLRAERGDVLRPEDTFALQRRLQTTKERVADYARGFKDVEQLIGQLQGEELIEAVGEHDGIPLSRLTIPSADGDIVVTPDVSTRNIIDADAVAQAIIKGVSDAWFSTFSHATFDVTSLREMLEQALTMLIGTGKYEPQVTKLKATAAEWARSGNDQLAGTLLSALVVKRVYNDGVKVERKKPK